MGEMKFNIGDTVKCYVGVGTIVCAMERLDKYNYGVQIKGYNGHSCGGFALCAGTRPMERNCIWILEEDLTLISSKALYKVVITSDGKRTKAVKYIDDKAVAKGVSSCDERYDEFSFNIGMNMALDRMIKNEINHNLYNGKAIALNFNKSRSLSSCFTPNKIYQFKDGYPVGIDNDAINSHRVSAITNDDMKNNTGWIRDWFFPVVE